MLSKVLISAFSAIVAQKAAATQFFDPVPQESINQDAKQENKDYLKTCKSTPFCDRHRQLEQFVLRESLKNSASSPNSDANPNDSVFYRVQPNSISVDSENGQIHGSMSLVCLEGTKTLSPELTFTLTFYQSGIMRVEIDDGTDRFKITDQDGLPLSEEGKLVPASNLDKLVQMTSSGLTVTGLSSADHLDNYEYSLSFDKFKIEQRVDGLTTLVVNPVDSLIVENSQQEASGFSFNGSHDMVDPNTCYNGIKNQVTLEEGRNVFDRANPLEENNPWNSGEKKQSVALGFYFPLDSNPEHEDSTGKLYGLPERPCTVHLQHTDDGEPYQLFATDHAFYKFDQRNPLYGSIPYITGVHKDFSSSVAWLNSAHTWVDIKDLTIESNQNKPGTYTSFVSEAGSLEFFIFASAVKSTKGSNRVQRVQTLLSEVVGVAAMPPRHTLGFHFSKWAPISAEIVLERSRNFTESKMPIDVLWSDLQYSMQDDKEGEYFYFQFNGGNFTESQIAQMNKELEDQGRHITVIVDPHIKASDTYFVFKEGMDLQNAKDQPEGDLTNIFVRKPGSNGETFIGKCWPGDSAWIDYLNENAQKYWGSLFTYEKFVGSSWIYHFWNDMNEPAIFDVPVFPLDNIHYKANGKAIENRNLKNAYGALHQRSSYRGLLARDDNKLRPFVLTRSFFMGSQKYGTYWTGDNSAGVDDVGGSIRMVLSNGLSGHPFGGADIPGFGGEPTDDVYIMFYQLGMYYPFFRAHSTLENQDREPWNRSQRVQVAIRDAINRRYNLLHYIYTAFYQHHADGGQPIMRPMWNEFPDSQQAWSQEAQFMLGDSLLVAPKVNDLIEGESKWTVDFFLPGNKGNEQAGEQLWYNFQTGKMFGTPSEGLQLKEQFGDLDQAVFARGGKIIPIMKHSDCYSVRKCIDSPIELEVFPDVHGKAEGYLYMDDGDSFEFQTSSSFAYYKFTYANGHLQTEKIGGSDSFKLSSKQVIMRAKIYGQSGEKKVGVAKGHMKAIDFHHENGMLSVGGINLDLNELSGNVSNSVGTVFELRFL